MRFFIQGFPRGVPLMFFNILMMYAGFYALIPFLYAHYHDDLLWSTTMVGVLLAVRQLCQQGVGLLTGMLADRLGYKQMLVVGMVVRGVGFALFGFAEHPVWAFLAAILAGLGGAMFEPARDATLTALTPAELRGRMFAAKKLVGNLGIALSALLSALLFWVDFAVLCLLCGLIYWGCSALTLLRLPSIYVQTEPVPFTSMWSTVIQDRPFVQSTLFMCGYYFMYMQSFLTIPMRAADVTGVQEIVALVNLLMAGLTIGLQAPVYRFIARYDTWASIQIGLGAMAGGLLLFGIVEHWGGLIAGFVLYVIGLLIVGPASNELVAALAKREVTATYFGFASLALAVGGGLGQLLGGTLVDVGRSVGQPQLIWWVCAVCGLWALWGMHRTGAQHRSNSLAC